VGEHALCQLPGVLSQMPQQGDIDVKIKVRVIKNSVDHPDELKLQARVVWRRVRQEWPSRIGQRAHCGLPLEPT
jgi:hypothetical protein